MRSAVVLLVVTICVGCGSAGNNAILTSVLPPTGVSTPANDRTGGSVAILSQRPDLRIVLGAHCAIDGLSIDGVWWEVSPVVYLGAGEIWSQAGVLHFIDASTATFTGKSDSGDEIRITFHRTSAKPAQLGCV